jgi:hypothetical protein
MEWKDIASKVGAFAPALGTLIGGPAGGAVGLLVAGALGVGSTPAAVAAALETDPQARIRLEELQSNERTKLAELSYQHAAMVANTENQTHKLEVQDRDSARRLAALDKDMVRPAITFVLLAGSVFVFIAIFTFGREMLKDPTASVTLGTIIGFWFNELKQAMAFYFGATRETSRQNQINMNSALDAANRNVQ